MIDLAPSLKATGGSHTGVNPVNLLDILDANGNLYYWADRPVNAPLVITGSGAGSGVLTPPIAPTPGQIVTWVLPGFGGANAGSGLATARVNSDGGAGEIIFYEGGPFTTPATVTFGGFVIPNLPAGAQVDSLYAVADIGYFGGDPLSYAGGFNTGSGTSWEGRYTADVTNLAAVGLASFEFALSHATVDGTSGTGSGTFGNPLITPDSIGISKLAIAIYYSFPSSGTPGSPTSGGLTKGGGPYLPWIIQVPSISFHRSLQTDVGSFVIQNLSGDTLSRDVEKLLRASTLEGAFAVYRIYQPDAEAVWLEVHGTLSVQATGDDTLSLKFSQLLNPSQDDTPLEIFCETCQLQWGGPRCGSTETTECSYSYQTCQVVERIMIEANDYEKNYGETTANTALNVINRRRKI